MAVKITITANGDSGNSYPTDETSSVEFTFYSKDVFMKLNNRELVFSRKDFDFLMKSYMAHDS